jgi:hypothetical protein
LQLKVLWKIWEFRDLTTGDTSGYFAEAYGWYEHFAVNLVWSPLYTSYYGTLLMLTGDAYAATILHRVVIVMAATLGVLAFMRVAGSGAQFCPIFGRQRYQCVFRAAAHCE